MLLFVGLGNPNPNNSNNRHRKRRAVQPCNSKIVDFGSYGYPTVMNYYFRDQNGKLYTSGYEISLWLFVKMCEGFRNL